MVKKLEKGNFSMILAVGARENETDVRNMNHKYIVVEQDRKSEKQIRTPAM